MRKGTLLYRRSVLWLVSNMTCGLDLTHMGLCVRIHVYTYMFIAYMMESAESKFLFKNYKFLNLWISNIITQMQTKCKMMSCYLHGSAGCLKQYILSAPIHLIGASPLILKYDISMSVLTAPPLYILANINQRTGLKPSRDEYLKVQKG